MATILKVGGNGQLPDNGGWFRILVIDRCDNCNVKEAHAIETDDETKCLVCNKSVNIVTAITVTFTKEVVETVCTVYASCTNGSGFRVVIPTATGGKRTYRACYTHVANVLNEAHNETT